MPREALLPTADDTREWGARLAGVLAEGDVVVLTGGLGAGKTTLTQGLAEDYLEITLQGDPARVVRVAAHGERWARPEAAAALDTLASLA